MRPAQFSQILPTSPLGREPRSKLLIRPRIVTPADRTVANHEHTLLHSSRYAGRTFDSYRGRNKWLYPGTQSISGYNGVASQKYVDSTTSSLRV